MRAYRLAPFAVLLTAIACSSTDVVIPVGVLPPPTNLSYQIEASGNPDAPSGLLLRWDDTHSPSLSVWHVYSRGATSEPYLLRGSTTSSTFHDNGVPHLQYYVTAEDVSGGESAPSNVVTIDQRLALQNPSSLVSTTLNAAVALTWADNAYTSNPSRFQFYRVYSTSYDLDRNLCGVDWSLEGTTVAPEFVAGALTNGVPRCFGVSAISVEGYESLWSPLRNDTPRPDSRNVVLYARQVQDATSGFRFWRDLNGDGLAQSGELGLVGSGSASDIDFSVERDATGNLFLTPVRAGTGIEPYVNGPVADLTSIDIAPNITYSRAPIQALPGWGYVVEMDGGDGFARYGAVRVTHVGQSFLILDWAFQTDPGNPELVVGRGP
jgi:hypothetical protein